MSKHTKGELRVIRTTKHPGDIFVKIKGTERKFLCKFYGGGGTEISPSEAEDNVTHFIKCWNAFEDGGLVEELRTALENLTKQPQCKGCRIEAKAALAKS